MKALKDMARAKKRQKRYIGKAVPKGNARK
jgi:hypothetical protein